MKLFVSVTLALRLIGSSVAFLPQRIPQLGSARSSMALSASVGYLSSLSPEAPYVKPTKPSLPASTGTAGGYLSSLSSSASQEKPVEPAKSSPHASIVHADGYQSSLSSKSSEASAMVLANTFPLASTGATNGYLATLCSKPFDAPSFEPLKKSSSVSRIGEFTSFKHAPIEYFAIPNLQPKGPRENSDVGEPHDATLPFGEDGTIESGSWWCAAGGWPSLKARATTEIFYVLEGHGCLTDLDGMQHYFGPGDTVILPKGWSGRWDVLEDMHKVWFVNDHPHIEEKSNPIRVRIFHHNNFAPHHLTSHGVKADGIHGPPSTASRLLYDVGPTEVGVWSCTPGSFPELNRATTECFHVLEGVFFLTNMDGSAVRCEAGDTVILPKGWSGQWDVIETAKKLWVAA